MNERGRCTVQGQLDVLECLANGKDQDLREAGGRVEHFPVNKSGVYYQVDCIKLTIR